MGAISCAHDRFQLQSSPGVCCSVLNLWQEDPSNLTLAAIPTFALAHHPKANLHVAPGFHPERPERALAARRGIFNVVAEPQLVAIHEATTEQILRCHTEEYLERLELSLTRDQGFLDGDTFFSTDTRAAAWGSAGGAIAAVDAMLQDRAQRVFLLARPPGHHATSSRAMGFCLLNNVAIAAAHAKASGLSRIAIVDWDVHHGNGTQEIFYNDPSVLFVSLHQWPLYPGTGQLTEAGANSGKGFTVNVPLPADSASAAYRASFERIVLPILDEYAPELVIISAGFDAHERDPLATMRLKTEDFQWMTQTLRAQADASARGHLLMALEGGYDLRAIEQSVQACVSELVVPTTASQSDGSLQPDERQAIESVLKIQRQYWRTLR
jgi:acetoin utilization deacetylase AcuC-like enzyme